MHEGRLADTGLTGDESQAGLSALGGGQMPVQLCQSGVASHQWAVRRLRRLCRKWPGMPVRLGAHGTDKSVAQPMPRFDESRLFDAVVELLADLPYAHFQCGIADHAPGPQHVKEFALAHQSSTMLDQVSEHGKRFWGQVDRRGAATKRLSGGI